MLENELSSYPNTLLIYIQKVQTQETTANQIKKNQTFIQNLNRGYLCAKKPFSIKVINEISGGK